MSMTRESGEWHNAYEVLPEAQREAIDLAYIAAIKVIKDAGYKVEGDDRAEELAAAITKYFVASGN